MHTSPFLMGGRISSIPANGPLRFHLPLEQPSLNPLRRSERRRGAKKVCSAFFSSSICKSERRLILKWRRRERRAFYIKQPPWPDFLGLALFRELQKFALPSNFRTYSIFMFHFNQDNWNCEHITMLKLIPPTKVDFRHLQRQHR